MLKYLNIASVVESYIYNLIQKYYCNQCNYCLQVYHDIVGQIYVRVEGQTTCSLSLQVWQTNVSMKFDPWMCPKWWRFGSSLFLIDLQVQAHSLFGHDFQVQFLTFNLSRLYTTSWFLCAVNERYAHMQVSPLTLKYMKKFEHL